MTELNAWVSAASFLLGSVSTGIASYFGLMRNQLTKQSHADICADKQTITNVQLLAINAQLADHGNKLDRLLLNGKGGN